MGYKIALMPGDGIGPEIANAAISILEVAGFHPEYVRIDGGLEYYRRTSRPIQEGALDLVKSCDAMLKGPVITLPGPGTYESVNVHLRKGLDLYVNFRPFKSILRGKDRGFDFMIFRENTEEAYSGIEWGSESVAIALRVITRRASTRFFDHVFNYVRNNGRKRATVIHKATILKKTDGLFRGIFFETSSRFPEIRADEMLVDAAAYQLVRDPTSFDVIVTPNSYGDILSDLAAGLVGSLGLCGSANIGDRHAIFEPVHGAALDVANRGIANPTGMILSAVYMLRWLGERKGERNLFDMAKAVEESVSATISKSILTQDLGGNASLSSFIQAISEELRKVY